MQPSVIHQVTLLGSIALLTLTSCTAQPDAKSSPQPTELSAPNPSQTELSPVVAAQSSDQPMKPTGNLLSPEQVEKLTRLPIPIVAPTYLPESFRVVKADGESGQYANGDDDSGYQIEYQRTDHTCFAIRSSQDGPRRLPQVGQVESEIGTVKIYEDTYQNRRSLQSFIPVKGNPVMISPVSHLNSATGKYEDCKALDRTEYERILKSIKLLTR